MSALEIYLKNMVETRGLLHARAVRTTREYIRLTDRTTLVRAIREIKKAELLRALWECGLDTYLQGIVIKQLDKIIAGEI